MYFMQTKGNFLYYLTAGWAALIVTVGLYYLFSSAEPTADVEARYQARMQTVPIESWEPGDVRTLVFGRKPVVIWRRDQAEMAAAMSQADPSIPQEDWAEALNDGSLATLLGPEEFARIEWLIVSPINTGGFGCIVLTKAGDYDGFFDPCQGAHFDLWGRPQRGPTDKNLKVHPIYFAEGGQSLVLDLSTLPSSN